jgi:hypothetical protein
MARDRAPREQPACRPHADEIEHAPSHAVKHDELPGGLEGQAHRSDPLPARGAAEVRLCNRVVEDKVAVGLDDGEVPARRLQVLRIAATNVIGRLPQKSR